MNYLEEQEKLHKPTVKELNILLADYHLYYQKLRNFHWNILGENFFDLHLKFEELYTDAREKIDEIAERILTLNFHPMSKYSHYLEISNITEEKSLIDDKKMVNCLIEDHGKLLEQMKKVVKKADDSGDEGTIDLIGAYIRYLEKASWMLNAWTKRGKERLNSSILKE
ncbi:Dps family protein [Altibacter sp. HG106]|uniref:Dps family protein n=1 Tax=Altibacter sp. HG106 TaxID=3023937 RepID=UPI0023505A83|nr:DNA starvation/stationary phase protection protein [Altibacter sp. HG106]MDC7995937.1 DNA starvation/stationary phase protection protein [Altibacter sp. HG106]